MSLRSEMGFPTGNTKPTEIQGAKSISHPLSCSASSIPQLGQAQGYQHPSSPLRKPSPSFSLLNRMRGCAGEGSSLGTVYRQVSWQLVGGMCSPESSPAKGSPSHKLGTQVTGPSIGAQPALGHWDRSNAGQKYLPAFWNGVLIFFYILSFPFL